MEAHTFHKKSFLLNVWDRKLTFSSFVLAIKMSSEIGESLKQQIIKVLTQNSRRQNFETNIWKKLKGPGVNKFH